jgi:methyl acetate hydrolase
MRRRDFMKFVGGTVALPLTAHAQLSNPIDDVLRGAVERKDVAGVVAMAADRMGVVYQGAFGIADIGEARPLKSDALFRIASMTKAITSVAAMQLIEQGRLSLDDPAE